MTAWQTMCRGIRALHRPDADGTCMRCTAAYGEPVAYPCPRAAMAAPVVRATATVPPRFAAGEVAGCRTEAAGHPPRPTPGR